MPCINYLLTHSDIERPIFHLILKVQRLSCSALRLVSRRMVLVLRQFKSSFEVLVSKGGIKQSQK